MSKQDIEKVEAEVINLRSEEVQEIMGRIPTWIERWGITAIGLLLMIILAGAALFPYPDTLIGRFVFMPKCHCAKNNLVGYAFLPAYGIGKIKKGQKVRIRLENYPDQEFGYLTGIVRDIANMPDKDGFYQVDILFQNGLKTSENIQLPIHSQMSGTTEIILTEKLLIEKIGIKGAMWNLR